MTKKVVYSVTKYVGKFDYRMKGIGKIQDNDLIMRNNERLEDAVKYCLPIPYKHNEFKGTFDEFKEIEVKTKHGNYDTIEVNTEYKIWYKLI